MTNQDPNLYEKFIVSNSEVQRFLHRTDMRLTEAIMKTGFSFKPVFSGTASSQPTDFRTAKQYFENGSKYGDAAIVIEIPRWLYLDARKKANEEAVADGRVKAESDEWVHDERISHNFVLKPEFIVGYIDRNDNSVHFNPKYYGFKK